MLNSKTFQPHLYIGVGETTAFFTLRETYLHERYVASEGPMGGCVVNGAYQGHVEYEVRSFHHFNLSQDAEAAWAKAQAAATQLGLPLKGDLDSLRSDMRDIKRADREELDRRAREKAELQEAWEAERLAQEAEKAQTIAGGVMSFGTYRGKAFADLPVGYLTWLVDTLEDFEEGSLLRAAAVYVRDNLSHLMLPKPLPGLFVGEPKQRLTLDVTVVRAGGFARDSFGGYGGTEWVHVTTMVSKEGACLVVFSPSWGAEEGEKFTIKATVKEHTTYQGQAQTVVQRVVVQ